MSDSRVRTALHGSLSDARLPLGEAALAASSTRPPAPLLANTALFPSSFSPRIVVPLRRSSAVPAMGQTRCPRPAPPQPASVVLPCCGSCPRASPRLHHRAEAHPLHLPTPSICPHDEPESICDKEHAQGSDRQSTRVLWGWGLLRPADVCWTSSVGVERAYRTL